ncbi:hypothetical protein NDU88_005292 [Pleurodeles waltl]|uniref:CCHC-type domain-containing protein n=1 Tax=Pleurodeles waltl TaxID=8319 RepID=A0AAV7MYU5_PLEWA|nr:hypothetical protein NDU88_005292 [Pleurodeles waltl]
MNFLKASRSALKRDAYIMASEGEPTPPEGIPAYIVMEEKGVPPCLWIKQWRKLTEKEGCLAFPDHGTFNTRILENMRWMLCVHKPPLRPAQYEALAVWDLMAIRQRQQKFERRMKKAEKTLAEARWDNESKMWRRGIVDGFKLFPAITQEDETQGKKATCKTDKGSSKPKETKRSWIDEDDSDDEEFLNQLLHDRPPPYAIDDNAPSTSAGPGNQTQSKEFTNTVQTSDTGLIQNGVSVPTAPDMQIQLQPLPPIQRIYPDVPVLETATSLMVPPDPIYTKSRGVDWPTQEPARDKVTGAPSDEVMKYYHKVIEFLKQKVSPKVTDWQKIDRTSQEVKESIHAYYERLFKAFKHYSGTETIEPKDMNHLVFRFVEGLRPKVSQMIKNHLICWQAKPIDEVLQYAKYCSDEIELKQRKLKEKQIKAAQAGMQGNGIQQMVQQQPQGNGMFQAQPRGQGRGFVNRGPDLNTVVVQNDAQGMKKMSPCHACGGVGHWKQECPNVVHDGVVQQSTDVGTFQNMGGPKLRGQNQNFQNNMVQMQGLQPMQQIQMLRVQPAQVKQVQQQVPMVPRQQMQLALAQWDSNR